MDNQPKLIQSVAWAEQYVSHALNVKFAGIVPHGVYRGFRVKPGGQMAVIVDHDENYPKSVAVVERNGYSITVIMDDGGSVAVPAKGTWFVCVEAHYAPTQAGYQRIVMREAIDDHHVVLAKVMANGDDDVVIITESMISTEERTEIMLFTPPAKPTFWARGSWDKLNCNA